MAFLVGLGAADADVEACVALSEVGDVEGDELGAAEGTGKPEEDEGAVAQPGARFGFDGIGEPLDVFIERRRLLGRVLIPGAPHTLHRKQVVDVPSQLLFCTLRTSKPRLEIPSRRTSVHIGASWELEFTQPPDLHSDRRRHLDHELVADGATRGRSQIAYANFRFFFAAVFFLTGFDRSHFVPAQPEISPPSPHTGHRHKRCRVPGASSVSS